MTVPPSSDSANPLTKRCSKCGDDHPTAYFNRSKDSKDGLRSWCKTCTRISNLNWNKRNPERARAIQIRHGINLRAQTLAAYGGACACCGETTPEFLCVDHTNNDGAAHRRSIGSSSVYAWLRRRGYPKDGFQLLCYNCNCAKANYQTCPHRADLLAGAA